VKVRPIGRRVACALGLLHHLAAAAGCDSSPPVPRLSAIVPERAYGDRPLRVLLRGSGLLPAYRIDVATGQRTGDASGFSGWVGDEPQVPLTDFTWRDPDELSATLAPGLPAGVHTVVVTDPRGARGELLQGFQSLGHDQVGPAIVIERPPSGTPLAPGSRLSGRLVVSDDSQVVRVDWRVAGPAATLASGGCPVDPGPVVVACELELTLPASLAAGDTVELAVTATDASPTPNQGSATRVFTLRAPPAVADVAPKKGGTAGGSEVVVRGEGFLPGSRVYFGRALLQPDGGIRLDDGTITGRTPPHPRGYAVVRAVTPLGEARVDTLFEFLPAPAVRSVEPAVADSAGGTLLRVTGDNFGAATRILVGRTLRGATPLAGQTRVSATEIQGLAPARAAATSIDLPDVRLSVFAVDPLAGWGALPDGLGFSP
jgi:hypothetical protein